MIKKLIHKKDLEEQKVSHLNRLFEFTDSTDKSSFLKKSSAHYSSYTIEFYEVIGDILEFIGFDKVSVTRDGDTNNRMDAIIIDEKHSIPIEIKSPKEIEYANIKSIRQALENKIVLLSRSFFPTEKNITSLSVAFEYPNDRSGVYELINDIHNTYGFNIGMISFIDLLQLFYEKRIEGKEIDLNRIKFLKGQFK